MKSVAALLPCPYKACWLHILMKGVHRTFVVLAMIFARFYISRRELRVTAGAIFPICQEGYVRVIMTTIRIYPQCSLSTSVNVRNKDCTNYEARSCTGGRVTVYKQIHHVHVSKMVQIADDSCGVNSAEGRQSAQDRLITRRRLRSTGPSTPVYCFATFSGKKKGI